MDNFTEYNEKSVPWYHAIYEYSATSSSKREIVSLLHYRRNTITKYLHGDYEALCQKDFRSGMD